jgi:chromosome segregation ATPase
MISPDVDLNKTKTLLLYLSLAKKKIDDRDMARKKLAAQISSLKKISTTSIKKRITELEHDIADAIVKEKGIKDVQQDEAQQHRELIDKIERLEKKLGKYLDTKEARKTRIAQLESKIKQRAQSRKEKIAELKVSIKNLEQLYSAAKKDKNVSKVRLKIIQAKIKKLKDKIKAKK